MSITDLLTQQAAQQRELAAQCAATLNDQVDLATLQQARAELLAQLRDIDQRIQTAQAYHVAVQTAEWLEQQARTLGTPPDAAEAIAATGLPVQPKPTEPAAPPEADDLPFNVVEASDTTKAAVAAITTGGTPIIDDPDHIEGGAAIVTVTDPVTPPGDGPRHA
ncbi:MAG TPA: hypothetical protein VF202_10800, partial [Trueperaceae bacterium]